MRSKALRFVQITLLTTIDHDVNNTTDFHTDFFQIAML